MGSRILDIPQKFYEFEQVFPLNSVLVSGFSYIQTLKTSKFIFTSPCIIKMLLYRWGATLLARCMVQWNRKIALENLNKQISENKNEVFVSCPFKEELFFPPILERIVFIVSIIAWYWALLVWIALVVTIQPDTARYMDFGILLRMLSYFNNFGRESCR